MRRSISLLLGFLALAVASACGGGGAGGGDITPSTAPSATPNPVVTVSPGPVATPVTLSGSGYSLTFTVPAITSGGGGMSAYLTTTPPTGVVAPQLKASQFKARQVLGAPLTTYVYLVIKASATTTFAQVPSFEYTLPNGTIIAPSATAFVAYWDPTQSSTGWQPVAGPGVVNGQNISFAAYNQALTFQGGSTYVYALIGSGVVTPPPSPTPTPTSAPTGLAACPTGPAGTFPMQITNNSGLGGTVTVYVYGKNPSNLAQRLYPTSLTSGATSAVTLTSPIPGYPLPANGCVDLPQLDSARVYVALGGTTLTINSTKDGNQNIAPNAPSPWTGDNASSVFDFLEYTWDGPALKFYLDVSAVDAFGLPISFNAANTTNASAGPAFGMPPKSLTTMISQLSQLGGSWPSIVQQSGTGGFPRIINPSHAMPADGAGTPMPNPTAPSFDSTYFANTISRIWQTYTTVNGTPNYLHLAYGSALSDVYGLVDPTTNRMYFYPGGPTSTPAPNTPAVTYIAYPTTWAAFANAGAFANGSGSPGDSYATNIGRAIAVDINRGTLPVPPGAPLTETQPLCGTSDWIYFYGASQTNGGKTPVAAVKTNWYSALLHANAYAPNPGLPGLSYAFADDDECNYPGTPNALYAAVTSATPAPGQQWNVTVNRP